MRLAELSERSGISTATVKYYLREGLLPPGRRISATQAEYEESHLRRLGLIRALTEEDLTRAARRYLDPDQVAVVIAGPVGDAA